jgi:hypothetical protein
MMSAMSMRSQDYRATASDCVSAANNSAEPEERTHWLMMAQAWFKLAEQAEKQETAAAEKSEEPQTDVADLQSSEDQVGNSDSQAIGHGIRFGSWLGQTANRLLLRR